MQIVGNGFLARHLTGTFADRFPDVTAFAAGVSSTSVTAPEAFDREAHLLYDVLRRCREEQRTVVFFSTASHAMYGTSGIAAAEDDPLYPPSVYGRHKLALETTIRQAGVDHLILRLSHLVGDHQRVHQLLPGLTQQAQSGTVTVLEGAHRDLLDVRDLMHVIDRLLGDGIRGETLNVASGVPHPVETIVDGIERRLGTTAQRTYLPGTVSITRASIHRLEQLVPDFRPAKLSGADYLDSVLDTYLPFYV
jgi:nucleoside-diphosphate-sugar epimerase